MTTVKVKKKAPTYETEEQRNSLFKEIEADFKFVMKQAYSNGYDTHHEMVVLAYRHQEDFDMQREMHMLHFVKGDLKFVRDNHYTPYPAKLHWQSAYCLFDPLGYRDASSFWRRMGLRDFSAANFSFNILLRVR
jgi:uncharacterized protein (UPF0335 family)